MTHEQLRDRLLDLAYGELSAREAREVEGHAASCEACGAELARMRATRQVMASLPDAPAPPGGERILLAAAREAARRAPRRLLPRWAWGAAVAAASLAAVAAVSYRIAATRPGGIGGEDPHALLGESPYAQPPREAAPPERSGADGELSAAAAHGPADAARPTHEKSERSERAEDARATRRSAPAPRSPPPPPRSGGEADAERSVAPSPPSPSRSGGEQGGARGFAAAPAPSARLRGEGGPRAERSVAPSPPSPPRSGGEGRGEGDVAAPSRPSPSEGGGQQGGARGFAAAPRGEGDATAAPAPAAILRYDHLRRSGLLRAELRTFPGCDGELWRKVERDPDGRVVSYAREGFAGERRVRVEAIYGADGRPARVTVTDVAAAAPLRGTSPWVPDGGEADGPPRCGR